MTIAFGVHCVYGANVWEEPARIERIAALMVDPRWPYQARYRHVRQVPRTPQAFAPVSEEVEPGALAGALSSPLVDSVGVAVARGARSDHAWIYVQTGRARLRGTFPLTLRAFCRMPERAEAIDAWVPVVDELVSAVHGGHAVIVASSSEDVIRCEVWLQNISIEGQPVHPDPQQMSGLAVGRRELGDRAVRPPHWGTYLSPAHVAAVGGRGRIVEVVQPPVLREVGELLYVQLSQHAGDALSPEAEERRRAFATLLAPITLPRAG